MRKRLPRVSVVIPCWRQERQLWSCLDAVSRQEYPSDLFETIVVHRGFSADDKRRLASFRVSGCEVFRPKVAVARNAGLRRAGGELVALLDSDCLPHPLWLTRLVRSLNDDFVAGIGGRVLSWTPLSTWVQRYVDRMSGRGQMLDQAYGLYDEFLFPFLTTQNSLYRRKVLLEIGGFDETLCSGDDQDLGWRLFLRGYQLRHAPDAVVYHRHPERFTALLRQHFRSGRAHTDLLMKYRRFPLGVAGTCHSFQAYARYLFELWRGSMEQPPSDACVSTLRLAATVAGRLFQAVVRRAGPRLAAIEPPAEDYLWQWHREDRVVLKSLRASERIELDEVASAIWLGWMRGWSPSRLVDSLRESYDVASSQAKRDIESFSETMRSFPVRVLEHP